MQPILFYFSSIWKIRLSLLLEWEAGHCTLYTWIPELAVCIGTHTPTLEGLVLSTAGCEPTRASKSLKSPFSVYLSILKVQCVAIDHRRLLFCFTSHHKPPQLSFHLKLKERDRAKKRKQNIWNQKARKFISLQIRTGFVVMVLLLIHHMALNHLTFLRISFLLFKLKVLNEVIFRVLTSANLLWVHVCRLQTHSKSRVDKLHG